MGVPNLYNVMIIGYEHSFSKNWAYLDATMEAGNKLHCHKQEKGLERISHIIRKIFQIMLFSLKIRNKALLESVNFYLQQLE